jgi:hypothetical protein
MQCKLTAPELRERKATVIARLKKEIKNKEEMANGFAYQFDGSDAMMDEIISFVKVERTCCDFFDFNLSIRGDGSEARLEITGPEGTKDFIQTELEL